MTDSKVAVSGWLVAAIVMAGELSTACSEDIPGSIFRLTDSVACPRLRVSGSKHSHPKVIQFVHGI